MKRSIFFFAALLLPLIVIAQRQKQPPTTQSANPLVGRWEGITLNHKEVSTDLDFSWIFEADFVKVTDEDGEQISRNPYSVDMEKSPKTIVINVKGEPDRQGWWEISGNELKIVLTINKGKASSSDVTMIFRRATNAATQPHKP